ncbi:hypothetical protein GUA87_09680 [Sneathiella sp. P13V-1]|uniref:DUF2235 domain-containing protein n=1 Tax=Sneathiella sp. P13V-1 TaxID=2697366 RepID=UPI00187B4B9A|nr:DUF2235 domain-containing protein [Sneathiella sp. P13V-1]MBE7637112.1 hypothetical protein [Sneathiella sp. P13V-1]
MSEDTGRNIILLSDGTCNSSIARDKSNVWRLYQALDQSPDEEGRQTQLVFYDDGVGTSGFRPLMLLGAVFGWGLSRNVRDLYADLCRHYQPGDRIYILGFSRGAYTARVLADFIATCGVVDVHNSVTTWPKDPDNVGEHAIPAGSESGFRRLVRHAYKSYRQLYWKKANAKLPNVVSAVGRWVRDNVFRAKVLPHTEFRKRFSHQWKEDEQPIEFIGVWDTVDALGLPVDELSDMLDKYIYPYKFSNHRLGSKVKFAAQAMAIDDCRHTFHPLLWDQRRPRDKERIQQVWFTGMHSDVGGGYPVNSLAYIPLCWMMDHMMGARFNLSPVRFNKGVVDQYRSLADPLGRIHNSRRGGAVLYRYLPRNIHTLSHEEDWARSVRVEPMVLHHSVLQRIAEQESGYAPVNIPDDFSICDDKCQVVASSAYPRYKETAKQKKTRAENLSAAEDVIALGRRAYFMMLLIFLFVLIFPFVFPGIPGWIAPAKEGGIFALLMKAGRFGLSFAEGILPQFWLSSYYQHICQLVASAGIFLIFYVVGIRLQRIIARFGYEGWVHIKDAGANTNSRPKNPLLKATNYLRTEGWSRRAKFVAWYKVAPFVAAVLLVFTFVVVAFQTSLVPGGEKADLCLNVHKDDMKELSIFEDITVEVDLKDPCTPSLVHIEEGKRYQISLSEFTTGKKGDVHEGCQTDEIFPFCDASYPANHKGLKDKLAGLHPAYLAGLTLKRDVFRPWFSLMAQVGRRKFSRFVLNEEEFVFEAIASGPMYFYVNDAVAYFSDQPDHFYKQNNLGSLKVTVKRME